MAPKRRWNAFHLQQIQYFLSLGMTIVQIARYYGVSRQRIYQVCEEHHIIPDRHRRFPLGTAKMPIDKMTQI